MEKQKKLVVFLILVTILSIGMDNAQSSAWSGSSSSCQMICLQQCQLLYQWGTDGFDGCAANCEEYGDAQCSPCMSFRVRGPNGSTIVSCM